MRRGVGNRDYSARVIGPWLGLVLVVCACLVLAGGFGSAQTAENSIRARINPESASLDTRAPNYRADSELVLIPVSVVDKHHASVAGLAKEHFKLFDDKVEQTISHFNSEDTPVSVGIVFDISGSMEDKLQAAREAVVKVLGTASPHDEFFLVQFNNHVDLVVGLTEHTADIQNRLLWIQPRGGTALLDAIHFSIHQFTAARNSRKALIIISDGGDNASRYTIGEVRNAVKEADVQIYAVGIAERFPAHSRSWDEIAGPALLHDVAEQSGGRMFEVTDSSQLPKVASKLSEALRSQYVLGYVPANRQHDGKFHKVQVKLMPPKGSSKLQAYWRRGYYAPTE